MQTHTDRTEHLTLGLIQMANLFPSQTDGSTQYAHECRADARTKLNG